MTSSDSHPIVVREPAPIFDRMFGAMEKVHERLDKACNALESVAFHYAVIGGKRIAELTELVGMKLSSYRDKDRTRLCDMIQMGLIDEARPLKFEPTLGERLQMLFDDPDG